MYPVVSVEFIHTFSADEVDEVEKEELLTYGGSGLAFLVTDDQSRGVLCLPAPGKHRGSLKYLAGQVVKHMNYLSYPEAIFKADGEPLVKALVELVNLTRTKLGMKTHVFSGPDDRKANGRAEREIQAVRTTAGI